MYTGFDKTQAQTIVSVLSTLSNVSLDTIYKEMVTKAQQVIRSLSYRSCRFQGRRKGRIGKAFHSLSRNKTGVSLTRVRCTKCGIWPSSLERDKYSVSVRRWWNTFSFGKPSKIEELTFLRDTFTVFMYAWLIFTNFES